MLSPDLSMIFAISLSPVRKICCRCSNNSRCNRRNCLSYGWHYRFSLSHRFGICSNDCHSDCRLFHSQKRQSKQSRWHLQHHSMACRLCGISLPDECWHYRRQHLARYGFYNHPLRHSYQNRRQNYFKIQKSVIAYNKVKSPSDFSDGDFYI